jgi:hypothetical protein
LGFVVLLTSAAVALRSRSFLAGEASVLPDIRNSIDLTAEEIDSIRVALDSFNEIEADSLGHSLHRWRVLSAMPVACY